MSKEVENLFGEFLPSGIEEWEEAIAKRLKGTPGSELDWEPAEGLVIPPYYRYEEDHRHPLIPHNQAGQGNAWIICGKIRFDSTGKGNQKALGALNAGASGLIFEGPVSSRENLSALLNDVFIDAIEIQFASEQAPLELLSWLVEEIGDRELEPGKVSGNIHYGPLSDFAATGKWQGSKADDMALAGELMEFSGEKCPSIRVLTVPAPKHDSITHQIAHNLGAGSEYLAQLGGSSGYDKVASSISFSFPVGTAYFMEIAKLRAFRLLWANVMQQYDSNATPATRIHCHTVPSEDQHHNMIAATTQAMSAIIGRCNSLLIGTAEDSFTERIARNTQLMLIEEARLDKVLDPSSGSHYIERLTQLIAEKSWREFQQIEAAGGFINAVESDTLSRS